MRRELSLFHGISGVLMRLSTCFVFFNNAKKGVRGEVECEEAGERNNEGRESKVIDKTYN